MTKENMKKLYDHYVATGNTVEAKKISDIPRYADFAKDTSKEKEPEIKSKKVK